MIKFNEYVEKKKVLSEIVGGPEMDPVFQANKAAAEQQLHALNEKFDEFVGAILGLPDKQLKDRLWKALQPFANEFNSVIENM